jgi:hypothetical protein
MIPSRVSHPHTPAAPETPSLDVMPTLHDKERYMQGYRDGKAFSEHEAATVRNQTLDEAISDLNRVSLTGFTKYTYRRYVLQQLNLLRHQSTDSEATDR